MKFTEREIKIFNNAEKTIKYLKIIIPIITLFLCLYIIINVWVIFKIAHAFNISFKSILILGKSPVPERIYRSYEITIMSRIKDIGLSMYSFIIVSIMIWVMKIYNLLIKCKDKSI